MAAVARSNRVIGRDMDVPWYLPEDLKRFKRKTTGHPVIMGRRTFESIAIQLGGPLPARRSLVLTRRGPLKGFPQVETLNSLPAALAAVQGEETVFILGGGEVYAASLPLADRMELTMVDGQHEGDTYFPPFEHLLDSEFELEKRQPREGYTFESWVRRPK